MSEAEQNGLLERYRRLNELMRDVASTLDLKTLLNHIVNAAADLCCAEGASILLYDEARQQLFFEAANNLDQPLMRGMTVPVKNSIAGWIVTNQQPIIINDAQGDPRHFKNIDETTQITTDSILGVPLITKDKVIGALEAVNKYDGDFDQEDQDLLMALGSQAAVAIENARLFQQSDLISELVHELRTPLTSLNTAARLLVNPDVKEGTRMDLVELILGETERLSEMTTAFLDLARLESARARLQGEEFVLAQLLGECLRLMDSRAHELDVRLSLDVSEDLPLLRADRDMIKQLVLNLLSNATKYNKPGGTVVVYAASDSGRIILKVSDTGTGIPPEYLPFIFEKFYRVPGVGRSAKGTGLGLSICQRIVDAHNGRIEVESRLGEGTTFTLYLPLASE